MSFFGDIKTRARLALDGTTGQEPPSKRLRSLLVGEVGIGDAGYGIDSTLGLGGGVCFDPLAAASYGRGLSDSLLLGTDARASLLRAALDQQIPPTSGLSSSLGSFGTVGGLGSLASLGSLGLPAVGAASLDRNLGVSQILSLKDPSALLGNSLASVAGAQIPLSTARTKTKLCKHFIDNRCKFFHLCSFAHSIDELKQMPDDNDAEGKALLERYKAKAEAEKRILGLNSAATVSLPEMKTKLCKFFIDGECRFNQGCHFAHSIGELKKLPEKGDVAGEALLERYHAKASNVQEQGSTSSGKAKLCKYFIVGICKFKDSCNFAHSIGELKNLPDDDDEAEKLLLEQYRAKIGPEKAGQIKAKDLLVVEKERNEAQKDSDGLDASEKGPDTVQSTQNFENSTTDTAVKVVDKSQRFLKTKLCKHFLIGACKFGKNCTYAHSIEELQPPADGEDVRPKTSEMKEKDSSGGMAEHSPQLDDSKAGENSNSKQDDKQGSQKIKVCKFFSEGTCRFGASCAFLHDEKKQGNKTNEALPQVGALVGPGDVKPTYKTRLCNMWEKDKKCTFGAKCHFAHGAEELRQKAAPSIPPSDNLVQSSLGLEALSRSWQLGFSSSLPYSYDVTDTKWRPFRAADDGIQGLGAGIGVGERIFDAGASEGLHLRSLYQNPGQLDQTNSIASLSSLTGANVGLTSNLFGNLPSWSMR